MSRQVGEAIAILLSRDSLLNSKNEYIQNCISRITVEEDKIARKMRLQEEEEAEKEEERAVQEFKEMKRPNKRKDDNVPTGWRNAKRIRMTPKTRPGPVCETHEEQPVSPNPGSETTVIITTTEGQDDEKVPVGWKSDEKVPDGWRADENIPDECRERSDGPTPSMVATGVHSDEKVPGSWMADKNIPDGWRERADKRLSSLRAKMEKESQRIIEHLDLKKMNGIIEDIRVLWKGERMTSSPEAGNPRIRGEVWKGKRMTTFPQAGNPNLLLTDWNHWWQRMEGEAECARRQDRKQRQAEKESFFRNRVQPNIILTGWTTWWSRMEAEKRKEEKFALNKVDWSKSRAYSNNIRKQIFIQQFFHTPRSSSRSSAQRSQIDKCVAEVNIKCGQSPKRKNFDIINQGSPAKVRKTNTFSQNLNYWKNIENSQIMPTVSNLMTKTKTGNISQTQTTKLEVVRRLDSPGGLNGGLTEEINSD